MANDTQSTEMTDGFHLVIDALKLNDIDTIFGLPGIPVTDLCRMAQAEVRGIEFIAVNTDAQALACRFPISALGDPRQSPRRLGQWRRRPDLGPGCTS